MPSERVHSESIVEEGEFVADGPLNRLLLRDASLTIFELVDLSLDQMTSQC